MRSELGKCWQRWRSSNPRTNLARHAQVHERCREMKLAIEKKPAFKTKPAVETKPTIADTIETVQAYHERFMTSLKSHHNETISALEKHHTLFEYIRKAWRELRLLDLSLEPQLYFPATSYEYAQTCELGPDVERLLLQQPED